MQPEEESMLEDAMEKKLLNNLQWSMIFYCFSKICEAESESDEETKKIISDFIKGWKKFTSDGLVKEDLQTINKILNSPKNIFHSALLNKDESIHTTELYQEKYNILLKKIEKFYLNSLNSRF